MATAFKNLVAGHANTKASAPTVRKDKLAETKRAEREVKEAFKAQREMAKEHKHEEETAMKEAMKFDRQFFGHSKRAAHEARVAERHEKKIAEGSMCEHGIWKCRICNPVTKHK